LGFLKDGDERAWVGLVPSEDRVEQREVHAPVVHLAVAGTVGHGAGRPSLVEIGIAVQSLVLKHRDRTRYAVVVQDVRGRYASAGVFDAYRHEGADGYDTVEHVASQPWCDGQVGTTGLSYPGAVQWLAAVETPPHLRCVFPAMCFSSGRRFFYFNGAFDLSWIPWCAANIAPEERRVSLDKLRSTVTTFQADFGAALDPSGEHVTLVTSSGEILDGDTALHAMLDLWAHEDDTGASVAVPLTASRVVERIAESTGHAVVRTPRSARALCAAAMRDDVGFAGSEKGGFVFPAFLSTFDAVMTVGMLSRLLIASGRTLDEVVADLPPFHLRQASLFCPYDKKGLVMRGVAEALSDLPCDLTDGIRADVDGGWVLVLPHSTEPVVTLYAEGPGAEEADALLGKYGELVAELLRV
jgi:hypothetical protein